MNKHITVVGIVGSLRKQSYNRSLMNAVKEMTPEGVTLETLEIGEVPLFNQDREAADYPKEAQGLKDKIKAAGGVIIATPEYNRSIPGVLKNMIDWTSRPYGTSAWSGKHVATMGATGGAIGTAVAQGHLRQILTYLNTRIMGQPEFYLGGVTTKLDANGVLTDESTKEHIAKFWDSFIKAIQNDY
jgi:chromate reductase